MFRHFNSSAMELPPASFKDPHYRFLAADGSTCTFFSTPAFSSPDYYCSPGHSANGVYSMHLNAFFDLDTHTYSPSAAKMNSVLSVISLTGTTFWMEEKMSISATAAIALITTWQTGTAFPVPYQGYPFQRTGWQF